MARIYGDPHKVFTQLGACVQKWVQNFKFRSVIRRGGTNTEQALSLVHAGSGAETQRNLRKTMHAAEWRHK